MGTRCFRPKSDGDNARVWTVILRPGKHCLTRMPPTRSSSSHLGDHTAPAGRAHGGPGGAPGSAESAGETTHFNQEQSQSEHLTLLTTTLPSPRTDSPGAGPFITTKIPSHHPTQLHTHLHTNTHVHTPTHTRANTYTYTEFVIHRVCGSQGKGYLSYPVFE